MQSRMEFQELFSTSTEITIGKLLTPMALSVAISRVRVDLKPRAAAETRQSPSLSQRAML